MFQINRGIVETYRFGQCAPSSTEIQEYKMQSICGRKQRIGPRDRNKSDRQMPARIVDQSSHVTDLPLCFCHPREIMRTSLRIGRHRSLNSLLFENSNQRRRKTNKSRLHSIRTFDLYREPWRLLRNRTAYENFDTDSSSSSGVTRSINLVITGEDDCYREWRQKCERLNWGVV